jgi:hypothetical protein
MAYQQLDGVREIIIVHGFGNAFSAEPFTKFNIQLVAGGSEDHHWNFFPPSFYFLQHLPAIHPGHIHIEHNECRKGLCILFHIFEYGHTFFTTFCRHNGKAGVKLPNGISKDHQIILVIVNV